MVKLTKLAQHGEIEKKHGEIGKHGEIRLSYKRFSILWIIQLDFTIYIENLSIFEDRR